MLIKSLALIMLAGIMLAQTPKPIAPPDQTKGVQAVTPGVAPDEVVLTLHGVCDVPQTQLATSGKECSVTVTRRQFDELVKAVTSAPQMPANAKRNLANNYKEVLAFAAAAKKAGIDQSPQFQATMDWLRLRTLAEAYRRGADQEASQVSDQQIEEYYKSHLDQFEEVKLRRLLVPKNNPGGADKQGYEEKALQVTTEFRARAAAGEDFDQLQKDLYTALGLTMQPPSTAVGNRRRSSLTPEVRDHIFAMQPGQVSEIEKEPYTFAIYKVEAKQTLPKERLKEEITREIKRQKLDTALKAVRDQAHADLNESYFGPGPAPKQP